MKLASLHFADLTPIPGTAKRVLFLLASEGWDLERLDDARVRCERTEPSDGGGTLRLSFVLERWPVVYEVARLAPEVDTSKARGKR